MARKREPNLSLSIEEIDPSTAESMLQHNTWNRRISERLVLTYAETMKEGAWVLNGEPIIFDEKERLQSGQHRLLAVIESGVTIKSVVVRGAIPENIYSLESGRRRRMTDVLTLAGEIDVSNLSSALAWTWRWENNLMDRSFETPTHTHQLRVLSSNPSLREELYQGRRVYRDLHVSCGMMTALFHQFYRSYPVEAEDFWNKLAEGTDLPADHPCYVLRRWFTRAAQLPHNVSVANKAAVVVKAFNAYLENRPVKALSWRPAEPFPTLVVLP